MNHFDGEVFVVHTQLEILACYVALTMVIG